MKASATWAAIAVLALLVLAPAGSAEGAKAHSIVVENAWARATPPGATTGGAYFTVTNSGDRADRLVGGAVGGAARVEVHEMTMDGGVMRMRPLEGGLEVPPGGSVTLEPGGLHLMLIGLDAPLLAGQDLTGSLTFENAGEIPATFAVVPIGAPAPEQ